MIGNLNYEDLGTATTHIVRGTPRKYDETGVTATAIPNSQVLEKVDLKQDPNNSSETIESIPDGGKVAMLREWVTGSEEWAYVRYENLFGYILTQHLEIRYPNMDLVLPKANIDIKPMTALGLALAPSDNWMENESPYYHSGNGEWWFTVILPYTCIESGTLENKRQEARQAAVSYMYDYFGLNVSNKIPNQSKFLSGLQSAYAKDYYLSARPGAKLAMLVTIPAIYIEYLKQNNVPTKVSDESIDDDYCITLSANSINDLDQAARDVTECMTRVYQKYLNSNLKVLDFDFTNEIFKQNQGIYWIKFLIKENNIVLDSAQNQSAAPDACTSSPTYGKIEVCFSNDEQYKLLAVNYYNNLGEKKALTNGLSLVKDSFPFDEPRFGKLFLNQHVLCNLPEPPPPKLFFEEYCIDPVPEYTISTMKTDENEKKLSPALKKLTPRDTEELGVYINTTLFLASLSQQYGNILDRDQAGGGGLGYNCYNSSKAVDAFKLKIIESRDSQFMYAGDIMNAIDWLCSLEFSDFPDMENKLGGGKGKTDGKGEDEDDDWGWGWLLGDFEDWEAVWELNFGDWKMPSWNPIDAIGEAALGAWKELKDQIYMNIVRFFLDAKCRMILASVVAAGAIGIGLGIGLSTYYKNQNKKNKLGESTPALPTPAELVAKDYGAENCNDIIQESLGSNNAEDYNKNLLQIFQRCGVALGNGQLNTPQQYLDGISTVTSPVELLALLEGSTSVALVNFIFSYTKENFPAITDSKNTPSKLAGLFICLGENTTDSAIENVQNKIEEKIKDIDYCQQIADKLADIMQEKCPNPEVFESSYNKEVGSNIEKYQEIITLLEDECNSLQINLYNNKETGEKGVLSVLNGKMKGEQKLYDNVGESLIGAAKTSATSEVSTLISGEKYEEYLDTVSYSFSGENKVHGYPYNGPKTRSRYRHFYGGQSAQDSLAPIYTLGGPEKGNIEVRAVINEDSVIKDGIRIEIEKPDLGETVQSVLQNNQNYDYSENYLQLSDNQIIFHSLINNFFEENSKDYMGNNLACPVPYGVSSYLLDPFEENDRFFGVIFETLAEKYTKVVGAQWGGDQSNALQAYTQAIINNFEGILDYSESKKEVTKYFDMGDYDDPNDSSVKSPKQFSMMNGVMHSYVRHHLVEYFASAMPFYEPFIFSSGHLSQDPIELYSDVIINYVAQKIQDELKTKFTQSPGWATYNSFINQTYDYVSSKLSYQTKQYTGDRRGLQFYADMNLKSVYEAFTQAINQVPDEYKKQKHFIQKHRFIYGGITYPKGLEVHTHNGGPKLFESLGSLNGEPFINVNVLKDKPYSLFADDRYNRFKNGLFFIQNYFYFEYETQNFEKAVLNDKTKFKPYLHGALNLEHLDIINKLMNDAGLEGEKLRTLFKSVRYGSRLCWGQATRGVAKGNASLADLNNLDPTEGFNSDAQDEVLNLAHEIFRNYQDKDFSGLGENNNKLPEYMYKNQGVFVNQKAMICVDGILCEFLRPEYSNNKEYYVSLFDDAEFLYHNGKSGDVYNSKDFSVVIPIFKIEEEEDMNIIWKQFMEDKELGNDLNDKVIFQNLMSSLINSDEFKALRNNCFLPQVMIHFNAISGVTSSDLHYYDRFEQTKNILLTSMQNVMAAKGK